jgi:hypothetical protein
MHTLQITEQMDDAFRAVLRIRDVHPGSYFFGLTRSRIKDLSIFLPKNEIRGVHLGSLILDLDFFLSRIRIRNTAFWELMTPDQ